MASVGGSSAAGVPHEMGVFGKLEMGRRYLCSPSTCQGGGNGSCVKGENLHWNGLVVLGMRMGNVKW